MVGQGWVVMGVPAQCGHVDGLHSVIAIRKDASECGARLTRVWVDRYLGLGVEKR